MTDDRAPDGGAGYRVYGRRRGGEGGSSEREKGYTVYRARPRGPLARLRREERVGGLRQPPAPRRARRVRPKRVLAWLLVALACWLAISVAVFLVSAGVESEQVDDAAVAALTPGGSPPFSATTILVLGSDQRPRGSREPGASTTGPSRSDSILLVRTGGGRSARLSIPRDTVVDIPGHGRAKINAAFAYGGPALSIRTVRALLGIRVNHVIEVDFTNFPRLIDALGGIDVRTSCVVARINGGTRNGGITLRLRDGVHHLDGRHALALARARKNECNPRESDLTRARRQQHILAAIRGRMMSLSTLLRLPFVAWAAPQAIRTDMGGPTLLGLAADLATERSPRTRVLRPTGATRLPDGEIGLTVTPDAARAAARRLMAG